MQKIFLLLNFLLLVVHGIKQASAQDKFSVYGYIKDSGTGEYLIGATVYVRELSYGTATNSYGYYSLGIPKGSYTLMVSYVGYKNLEKIIMVDKNLQLYVELEVESTRIDEVVVRKEKSNANVTRPEMSMVKLEMKKIRQIPALMGEVDVIKAIQFLPGVINVAEGSSSFSVRGGAMDHNLILLDEATVYNASHFLGFFSIFNNDAIKDIKLYKADMPASMGGRLASVLDIRMKEGNSKEISGTGGIGSISSRFTLEMPIVKDTGSLMISGRRTYADLFFPLFNNDGINSSKLYFYDLNAKVNYMLNSNNRVFISSYFGRDVFGHKSMGMGYGNNTITGRWNHIFGRKLFLNTSLIWSNYLYYLKSDTNDANAFKWDSKMNEFNFKLDFTYFANSSNTIKYGVNSSFLSFNPGVVTGTSASSFVQHWEMPKNYAFGHGFYIMNEQQVAKFVLKYGVRLSVFQNVGSAKSLVLDDSYEVVDTAIHKSGDIFNTYINPEPRFGITYLINDNSSVKASYTRSVQYIQQASNSQAGSSLDVWFPASPNIKPQVADQWALGYFRNFFDNSLETSVETYYKSMHRLIDFKDFASLLLNDEMEADIRVGKGYSYGVELFGRFTRGKLDGWLSYTYSRTYRTTADVNFGRTYKATYDKPHNISAVFTYSFNNRVSLSANWLYSSGQAYTQPVGRYEIEGVIVPIYSERNSKRYPDYHRLDLSLTVKSKRNFSRKWQGEWNFSIYNVYNRKNAWVINFVQDEDNPTVTYAEKTYLFPVIPSVTYNFKF